MAVTPAPGWSSPIITTEDIHVDFHGKTVQITETNHIHQIWRPFAGQTRVAYKCMLFDGSVVYPETMISNDVWSVQPTSTNLNGSIAGFWRESAPAWYCVRDSDGSAAVPTSLYISDPYVIRPLIHASADSLGRIHAAFETSAGVVYNVFEPGIGEVRRDTIPASLEVGRVLVEGSRVHIVFIGTDWQPDYIQYNLDGSVTIPTVSLVEDLTWFGNQWTMAVDAQGNLYCFFIFGRSYNYFSLFKIEASTGNILIYDKEIYYPVSGGIHQTILPSATGDSLYLLWIENEIAGLEKYVMFSIIDQNGDFVVLPYAAYDYSDEDPQQLHGLQAATNDSGDVVAIWDAYFAEESGFYIVMGWFDHEWLGIEDETASVTPANLEISFSPNPFTSSLSVSYSLPETANTALSVYDLSGRLVEDLITETVTPGAHTVVWNPEPVLPDGCYLIVLDACGDRVVRRAVLLR